MKVVLKESEDSYDFRITHDISVFSGEEKFGHYIGNSEPEDCIIGRDLVDGHDIIKYMEIAYEAGKNGEELEIIYKEEKNN